MPFHSPLQKWTLARGRAKWRVSGLHTVLRTIPTNQSIILSDFERRQLELAFEKVDMILSEWDKTTKELKEEACL